jgi:copper oxidase (laccase) domain-containing protein
MEHLITQEHVDPSHVIAYIGPAIAYRSFEVGRDVIDQILSMSFDTSGYITYLSDEKALVNNRGLNKQMLLDAGVPMENITINKSDTFSPNDALFSYRRDHHCGRHLSYIIRKDID